MYILYIRENIDILNYPNNTIRDRIKIAPGIR